MTMKQRQAGLTLLEILIAISIFSMIGVTSFRLLGTAIDSEQLSKTHSSELSALQKSFAAINRDMLYFAERPIREGGKTLASLMINQEFALEFSRAGWNNPLLLDRSQLQRVAYSVGDHPAKNDKESQHYGNNQQYLLRHYWLHMDRPNPQTGMMTQALLAGVNSLNIEVITNKGRQSQWPKASSAASKTKPEYLLGIDIALRHEHLGDMNRLYRLN